ncbi:DUF4395 domain-containing protein [Sulfurimonas sp. MAG313]|nr:DUF4395 domain-containing protein [Sulfurimonas sp. MAG313]MDF1879782.1 DUF4395 domain-containing protein [Sulfurimonas sp. MAG313]
MAPTCPIAFRQIDGTIVRINALSLSLILIAYLLSNQIIFIYVLGFDLMIRLFLNKGLSPINQISRLIKVIISAKTHNTDAGAKRLAAYFALGFAWSIIGLHSFGLFNEAKVLSSVFILFASLEWIFNFCVGCKIYFIYKKMIA